MAETETAAKSTLDELVEQQQALMKEDADFSSDIKKKKQAVQRQIDREIMVERVANVMGDVPEGEQRAVMAEAARRRKAASEAAETEEADADEADEDQEK